MILSYEKLPCEKQRPFSSTLCRVLCISLSFFWPSLAISEPASEKLQPQSADAPVPQTNSVQNPNSNPKPNIDLDADSSAVATNSAAIWDLTDKTDREINGLVRSWPQLNAAQRRDLLAEVRVRMNKARAQATLPNKGQGQRGQSDIEVGLNRAQRQFKYGQSIPRNQKGTVVITAKVTRILPDGTRVTQSTVTPVPLEEFRKRAASGATANIQLPSSQPPIVAAGENPDSSATGGAPQATSGNQAEEKPRRQVFRATVRFGAGFGRRDESSQGQLVQGQLASAQQNVQQVSTPFTRENEQSAGLSADISADQANEVSVPKSLEENTK